MLRAPRGRATTTATSPPTAHQLRRRIQAGPQNIWRYADFLPLANQPGPSARASSRSGLPAGCTPLIRADRLAERLGLREVWVKNDAANPTHSFKDRVVSVASTRARELGYEVLACASTGNLANSVAAHGAALGMETYVFIPSDLEEQKILATGVYGTNLVKVRGNYDDVNRLCTELSGERDWAFVNVNMRPYYAEGSKTLAYEIAEQLGWETPDRIVAPIASGSLYTKIAKGFSEWLELGPHHGRRADDERRPGRGLQPGRERVRRRPATSAQPVRPKTIAKSLAIGNPADGPYALDLARRTGGSIDQVTDDEIRAGIRLLAETTGHLHRDRRRHDDRGARASSPSAATSTPGERVVLVITGEGLKTLDAVRGTFESYEIAPSYDEFVEQRRGRRGARLMAVKVKIPTQLRAATGGAGELEVAGGDRRRGARCAVRPPRRAARPPLRRRRRPAALRQRLRRRRGHPLHRRARHAGRRRRGGPDPARGRGRLRPRRR